MSSSPNDGYRFPSRWAFITHEHVGSELVGLTFASEAVLIVAATRFDEQGQEDESGEGRQYYRYMADACRCLLSARQLVCPTESGPNGGAA